MKDFSKVYCDRVYFLCAERFVTGSGFEPPAAPPYPFESRVPPPPGIICSRMSVMHKIWHGRRAHKAKHENINNSDLDGMSLASFCQRREV